MNCRTDTGGEVANQAMHVPFYIPKVPGRLYYYFGKPIETKGKRPLDSLQSNKFYLYLFCSREGFIFLDICLLDIFHVVDY